MTTISEAIEVMGVVAACHHRTAPRMDDREVVLVTAEIWAELFEVYKLSKDDLIAAVKKRARGAADAPEPAEIIADGVRVACHLYPPGGDGSVVPVPIDGIVRSGTATGAGR